MVAATATIPERIHPTRGAPERKAIWAPPSRIAAMELLNRMSLGSSLSAVMFCLAKRRDPTKKMRLPFLPKTTAERIITKSAVVTTGNWNTMAEAMPTSSATRFSFTIGNGMPTHVIVVVEDDMICFLYVNLLFFK